MCNTRVSWEPNDGGYYPVICNKCDRVIGSVHTLVGRETAIREMAALHYCSTPHVRIIDHNKLAAAQAAAKKGDFSQGNEFLKQAYTNI